MSNAFGPPPGVNPAMPAASSAPQQPAPAAQDPTRVTVGPLVISYPNLFIPRRKDAKDPNSPLMFSAEFICFAENPAYQAIAQKLMAAAEVVCQEKFKRSINTMEKQPLRPIKIRPGHENREGFFFGANSNANFSKPQVFVGNPPQPVTDPDVIYPGAIVYVGVKAGAYESNGNKGIKFYLNSVLKCADGTPLVAPRDATRDFADIMGEIPMTTVFAPPAAAYGAPAGFAMPPAMPPGPPQMPAYPPQGYAAPPVHPGYPQQPVAPPMPGYAYPPQH